MVVVGMGLVYMIYPGIAPGMIVPFYLVDKIEMVLLIATAFPPVIIGILKSQQIYDPYVFMGNWGGKHNEIKANGDLTLTPKTTGSCAGSTDITLTITKAEYKNDSTGTSGEDLKLSDGGDSTLKLTYDGEINDCGGTHTLTRKADGLTLNLKSPDNSFNGKIYNVFLKIEEDINLGGGCGNCKLKKTNVSLGTYTISGSGTNFTGNPDKHDGHQNQNCCFFGNQYTWSNEDKGYGWHSFLILIPIKISLAIIFVYCLHHRDSAIARSIINQPKMSTFLSIVFYMCHECLLAVGFPGLAPDEDVLLPMQLIGAFLMVLPAFYSEGYIIEYKNHDPAHWPTTGMTKWNAFCFWCKRASKITNHNLRSLFTTDLRRGLYFLFIFKLVYLDYNK